MALHSATVEAALIDHFAFFEFEHPQASHGIVNELPSVNPLAERLEPIDPETLLNSLLEVPLVYVSILVLYLTLAMYLPPLEFPLILRPIFKVHHPLPMLSIVLPATYVHVTVGVLAKTVAAEFAINEDALIPYATILNEHTKTMMFTVAPLAFIVLSLILPYIYAVAIEVVLMELPLIPVVSLLEEKHTEPVHDLARGCGIDLPDVFALRLLEPELLDGRIVEYVPDPPVLISHAHVLVVFSEYHVELLQVQGWAPELTIDGVTVTGFVIRVLRACDARTVHERYQTVCHP